MSTLLTAWFILNALDFACYAAATVINVEGKRLNFPGSGFYELYRAIARP
jgi:hypothetical protein